MTPWPDWREAFPSWARQFRYGVWILLAVLLFIHILAFWGTLWLLQNQSNRTERPKQE